MRQRFRAIEIALFVLPHACLVAVILFWDALAPSMLDIVLASVMYVLGMLGFEVALHRYFAHRAFVARLPLRVFLAFAACVASQGPVLWWVWAHRHHHRYSDTGQDLHSPLGDGTLAGRLWHSHIGWHIRQSREAKGFSVPPDLAIHRTAVAAHRAYYPLLLTSLLAPSALAFAVYGDLLSAVRAYVWVSGVRMVLQLHFTCALTSIAHLVGRRAFPTHDNSRNIGWLALPTLGASWHNNHHAHPRSATLWLRWWQVDISYAFIAAMALMGAAEKIQYPGAEMIYTLGDLLTEAAVRGGERPRVFGGTRPMSYRDLADLAHATGATLRSLGLSRGDRIAMVAEKSVVALAAMFGAAVEGLVFVPINPAFSAAMMHHILQDSGCRAVICRKLHLADLAERLPRFAPHRLPLPSFEGLDECRNWCIVPASAPSAGVSAGGVPNGNDVAALLYTSGSTGMAKGVVVAHRNFIAGAASVNEYLGHASTDRLLAALPLSFDAGLSVITTAMASAATVVLHSFLRAEDCIRTMAEVDITGITAVPPLYQQLVDVHAPQECPSLRYFANTGGAMPMRLLQRLRERFPAAAPTLMYGLTEAFRSTYLPPEEIDRRPASIGKAIPGAEVRVLRPDGGECADRELGEIVHRGPTVTLGYWGDPARTAKRFRPFRACEAVPIEEMVVWSGDFGYRDSEGFLYYVGRKDEQMKASGYRVSPTEVEQAILATGAVQEACVFGVQAGLEGEANIAAVTYPGIEVTALAAALRARVPSYMIPASVHGWPQPLPRNENGKIDRVSLRRWFDERLPRQEPHECHD